MAAPIQFDAVPAAFPVRTKQASAVVDGIRTDVSGMPFADKLLITISQDGKLAHWVHVPLDAPDPSSWDRRRPAEEDGSDLLPLANLTPATIFGGGNPERETLGHLMAAQVATAVVTKNPAEQRLLVVGMGLKKAEMDGNSFAEIIALVIRCL